MWRWSLCSAKTYAEPKVTIAFLCLVYCVPKSTSSGRRVTMVHPMASTAGKDSLKKVVWVVVFLLSTAFALLAWTLPARSQAAKAASSVTAKPGEWRYLNGDSLSTRYSPLDQINKDRKSTRLNSSHVSISYAVFCLKNKTIFHARLN